MSNDKQSMKLYTKEEIKRALDNPVSLNMETDEFIDSLTPIELPSDEEIIKHIDYLISCRQNLIDNADNMPQHLLEGGCMAFESAIDNARELFLGGNNEADNYYN